MRAILISGYLIFSAFTAVIFAHAEVGVSDNEILIGSCSALTGQAKDYGAQEVGGAKAYLDYINREQGGVHSRTIKLIAHDDKYEPANSIECYNGLIDAGVFATAFFVGTPTSAKYVVMAEEKKIPAVGFATGAPFLYEPFKRYVFSLRASYTDEASAEVEHLWKDVGIRRIGIIFQSDAFGGAGLNGVTEGLKKMGSTPVVAASFPRDALDSDKIIQEIQLANPEAVFLVATYVPAAEILKASLAAGLKPRFIVLAGRDSYIKEAGKASEGLVWAQMLPDPNQTNLPGVALYRRLMKKYSPEVEPEIKALEGFVHARILVEALNRAGSDLTRKRLIESLESIHELNLGLGPEFNVSFSPGRHQGNDQMYFTVVQDGKSVIFHDWKSLR